MSEFPPSGPSAEAKAEAIARAKEVSVIVRVLTDEILIIIHPPFSDRQ